MKVNAMKNNFLIPILCIVAAMACAGCRSVEDPGFSVYYNKDIMNNPAKAELWLVQYIQGNLTECKSRVLTYMSGMERNIITFIMNLVKIVFHILPLFTGKTVVFMFMPEIL